MLPRQKRGPSLDSQVFALVMQTVSVLKADPTMNRKHDFRE